MEDKWAQYLGQRSSTRCVPARLMNPLIALLMLIVGQQGAEVRVVTEPPGAEVWLAEVLLGTTTESGLRIIDIGVGVRAISIRKPGYLTVERAVRSSYDEPVTLLVRLHQAPQEGGRRTVAAPAPAARAEPPRVTIPMLVGLLGEVDPVARSQAANHLVTLGDAAVPALESALKADNPQIRARSAWVLGEIRTDRAKRAADALRSLIGDADAFVRKSAGDALAKMGFAVPVTAH